jgi:hypothetical protein
LIFKATINVIINILYITFIIFDDCIALFLFSIIYKVKKDFIFKVLFFIVLLFIFSLTVSNKGESLILLSFLGIGKIPKFIYNNLLILFFITFNKIFFITILNSLFLF